MLFKSFLFIFSIHNARLDYHYGTQLKHELSTINMLYSLKEILLYHYTPNSP